MAKNHGAKTRAELEQEVGLLRKHVRNWTSHRLHCERLRAEVGAAQHLPDCTCGFFDAMRELGLIEEKARELAAVLPG